jgi:protein subunit release factor B
VETFRAGGPGGQHQNTTDSAVRLTHLATGIRATSRAHRSQLQNKREALRKLRERLAEARRRTTPRIPTRVPSREKKARLESKRRRAGVKKMRKRPDKED